MRDAELECTAEANHEWLLDRFVGSLLDRKPRSVLDVGCGAGLLLKRCRSAGIEVVGLDQSGPRLDALREEELDVREGSAYELPFADRSVDWVTMRHIPHHLEEPARAVAEAWRVTRCGLLIAEPNFDPTVPSQRGGLAVDRWEKCQHRRGGMYHAESLDLGALLALLPERPGTSLDLEVRLDLRLRTRSIAEFERDAKELIADRPAEDEGREALARLLDELAILRLSWNGSLCVACTKPG